MKQYIDKADVMAEIEKLQLCTMDEDGNFYSPEAQGEYNALCKLESFIDTLETKEIQEEPVSKDLEEACDEYYDETWDEHGGKAMVVDGCHDIWFPSQATDDFYKAGALWQKEQVIDKACEFINKANLYLYHCISEGCDLVDTDKMIEDFKIAMEE